MTQLLPVFLGAALVVAAAWLAGRAVAPRLPRCLSFGIGAILLSYAVFVLMLAHQAHRSSLIGVLVTCIAAGLSRKPNFMMTRPPTLVIVIYVPFAVWYLVNALAPEVHADPNVYHLQPAIDALRYRGFSGNISFYEQLPQAIEMLFVPAWLIGGSSAAKLVHASFLLATLPTIVHIARQLNLPNTVGHIAAAFYFCTPIVGLAGTAAFNDAALVYFTVAAVALSLERRAFHAGLVSGFCYGIKMTGLIAVPVAMAFFLARRQWRLAFFCCIGAMLTVSPWLLRNIAETGNPFAPFLNRWFPNPYFYILTEQTLTANLRSYGISFWQRFPELLAGHRLHGIIGPAFMIAPVAVLAMRRRSGIVLLVLALVLSVPWWMNAGARFLMPALPFLTLALCAAIPTRAAVPILILHAITSWPTIVDAYTPKSLQLNRFPWRAALRIESEQDYLARVSLDYRYVKLVEQNTPEGARILDLIGAHRAFTTREFVGSWSTSLGIRSLEALEFARAQGTPALQAIEATFEPSTISGVRIVESANTPEAWNLHSVELRNRGARVNDRQGWMVSSTVNRWELPFAFDANVITRWSSWQAAERGMFVQVNMERPIEADSVRILTPLSARTIRMEVQICRNGKWQRVRARSTEGTLLNLRAAVTATLKKAGITHILTPAAYQGIGFLGEKLVNEADDWNMDVVGNLYAVYLLKLR